MIVLEKRAIDPAKFLVCAANGGTGSAWDVQLPDQNANVCAGKASGQVAKAGIRLARVLRAIWP